MSLPRFKSALAKSGNGTSPPTWGSGDWTTLGVAAGDLLLMIVGAVDSLVPAITGPASGWTNEVENSVQGGFGTRGQVWWRVASGDSGDDASWDSDGAAGDGVITVVYVVPAGDFDPADPIDAVASSTTTNAASIPIPSVAVSGRTRVIRAAIMGNASVAVASGASTDLNVIGLSSTDPGTAISVYVADSVRIKAGTVASGTLQVTAAQSASVAVSVALKPDPNDPAPYIADRSVGKLSTQAADITFTRATDSDATGALDIQNGDIILLSAAHADASVDPTFTLPADFTEIVSPFVDGGVAVTGLLAWKLVTDAASEPATYTLLASTSSATNGFVGRLFVIREADPIGPNVSTSNTATGAASLAIADATTTEDDCLCFYGLAVGHSSDTPFAPFIGVEVCDIRTDPGNGASLFVGVLTQRAAGLPGDMTVNLLASMNSLAGMFVAFAPLVVVEGASDLDIVGVGDITMEGHPPTLDVTGVGDIVFEGRVLSELLVSSAGIIEMEGEAGTSVSQVMTPLPIRTGITISFSPESDAVDGGVGVVGQPGGQIGGDGGVPAEPPEEEVPGVIRRPSSKVWITRVIREAPDIEPFVGAHGRLDVKGWTEAFPEPTIAYWGRYKINVGGRDVTFFRGVPTQVISYSRQEPFSELNAEIFFPQIYPYEELPSWLADGANVDLYQVHPDGTKDKLWEGMGGAIRTSKAGVTLECFGAMFQLDRYVRRAVIVEDIIPNDIGVILQDLITKYGRDKGALRIGTLNRKITGIKVLSRGDWNPQLTGYISELLHLAQDEEGNVWTIHKHFGRKPRMKLKDMTTQHYSIHVAEQGVELDLVRDWTTAPTTIFGEGEYDGCSWYNAKYPRQRLDDAPIFFGSPINPGDTDKDDSMLLFEREMYERGWGAFNRDGNYNLSEEDDVRAFQSEAGISVDGIIGPQTWAAAFDVGSNGGSLKKAFPHSLYSKRFTEAWNRDASGQKTTRNPTFNPKKPRVERHISYGTHISKKEARRSAALDVERDYPASWLGTIELTTDPPEKSRRELLEGRNILVRGHQGEDRLMHISQVDVDESADPCSVKLLVDEKGRDSMTLHQMLERDRKTHDPNLRKERHYRNTSKRIKDDKPIWDCENGAGIIPEHAITGGAWNVLHIPAGSHGTIVRAEFTLRHPALCAIGVFDRPVTAAQLVRVGPLGPLAYFDYWDTFPDPRDDKDMRHEGPSPNGLIIGWGSSDEPGGLWPWTQQQVDEDNKPVTGRAVDTASWYFESEMPPWLWVAIYVAGPDDPGLQYAPAPNINYISGRLYPASGQG